MQTDRRKFLKKIGAAAAGAGLFPVIVKASALGRNGHVAPSDRITMVMIGSGGQGRHNLRNLMNIPGVQPVAVCDVVDEQAERGKKMIDDRLGNNDCRVYKDFREIIVKEKPDTAIIATPDHWHMLLACEAANNKVDIYGEKPMARSIVEGRAIVEAVERNNVIWQTGSQQRSESNFHYASELVRNGRIGEVKYVEVGLPDGGNYIGNPMEMPVPDGVDWDMWLGPAPFVPFRGVLHWDWRWILDYSGGQLTDWAGHHIDIAHWGLGLDKTGPVTVEGTGRPNNDGIFNVLVEYDFTCEYANGVKIRVASQSKLKHGMGTAWYGSDGWIHVTRGGLKASDENILKEKIGDNEIRLYKSTNHHANFIDCVKSRKETITPAETGHRSVSVALLGEIAILTGQKLNWNPETETFSDNNVLASRLLKRPYRSPWKYPSY